MPFSIEAMATFCKKKGFIFPNSEIYNGLAGFFDYGPLGVELKNNLKQHWWKRFVQDRDDIVGIDGAILSHQNVWKASGHVDNFEDILVEDIKTKERFRADHLVQDALNIAVDGLSSEDLMKLIKENKIKSPQGNELSEPRQFNLMFRTNVGPIQNEHSVSYLRPETAQLIFTNFKLISETSRVKLPFGIAQQGKAFRNEISPRDFLFRCREFEQMEIEFFLRPDQQDACPVLDEISDLPVNLLNAENQEKEELHQKTTIKEMLDKKMLTSWHAYWLGHSYQWFLDLGVNPEKLRLREHLKKELSHYSSATFDVEYEYPMGWKEVHGNANRGAYDLTQHELVSKKSQQIFDEQTKEKLIPQVIEPSQGVERAFLTMMFDAYHDDLDRGNVVLKLHPALAPIKLAVFPLLGNKPELLERADAIYQLLKARWPAQFDKSGTVGRRYARADEIGIVACVTVDFDTLEKGTVTIRSRDTTQQIRIKEQDLIATVERIMDGAAVEELGKIIETKKQ